MKNLETPAKTGRVDRYGVGSTQEINNISRATQLKLDTIIVTKERLLMMHPVLFPWQHSWLQSLSSPNQILPFVTV